MPTPSRIEGDLFVNGNISAVTQTIPSGAVTNASIAAAAGISASKQEHRFCSKHAEGSDAAAASRTVFLAGIIGVNATVVNFKCGLHTLMTNAGPDDYQVVFDLQKQDGTSLLSAPVTMNKSTNYSAKTLINGVISGGALVAGNNIYVVITATGATGTQGKGAFAQVEWNEDAS